MNMKKVIKTVIVVVPIMLFCILNMQTDNSADASQVRDKNIASSLDMMADFEEGLEAEVVPKGKGQRLASEDVQSTESEAMEESTEAIEENTEIIEESTEAIDDGDKEDSEDGTELDAEDKDAEVLDDADESDENGADAGTGDTGMDVGNSNTGIGSTGTGIGSSAGNDSGKSEQGMGTVGYILIGDSRFVGMDEVVDVDSHENQYIIAKCGAGHDFLVNEALPRAAAIEVQHREVDTWVYIINLGVNDLQSAWKYVSTYRSLVVSKNVVIQSVNPIEYTNIPQTNQARIKSFNDKMKLVQGASYLDTYNALMRNGFSTIDGLHYTEETSDYIYECIKKCMREIESKS